MDGSTPGPDGRRHLSRRLIVAGGAGLLGAALDAGNRGPLVGARASGGAGQIAASPPAATPIGAASTSAVGEEVAFDLSGGATTRGVFDYPRVGRPPFPAVLLIQGSGPIDRDETFVEPDGTTRRPFLLIAQALTERGLAVFRFDKRGVCPPSRPCDPAAYAAQTKPVLTEDAALAYTRMVANPLVDPRRTAVLGHSEGTWLAPTLPARFPAIRALVLVGTGLGPMHVLQFSQVTLPLLGAAAFDADGDGALGPGEIPFADPAGLPRFFQRIRIQGQLFLLRYEGSGPDLRPVGLNRRLDTNGDGMLDLLTELRPAYEALLAGIAHPQAVVERYADPSVVPTAGAAFAPAEQFDAGLYASYQAEPIDQNLRAFLSLPHRPRLLIVNGEHDDQTPASSARLLADRLVAAGYAPAPTLRIYPDLGHVLSPQADPFAPYGADIQPRPVAEIGDWLVAALGSPSPPAATPIP